MKQSSIWVAGLEGLTWFTFFSLKFVGGVLGKTWRPVFSVFFKKCTLRSRWEEMHFSVFTWDKEALDANLHLVWSLFGFKLRLKKRLLRNLKNLCALTMSYCSVTWNLPGTRIYQKHWGWGSRRIGMAPMSGTKDSHGFPRMVSSSGYATLSRDRL